MIKFPIFYPTLKSDNLFSISIWWNLQIFSWPVDEVYNFFYDQLEKFVILFHSRLTKFAIFFTWLRNFKFMNVSLTDKIIFFCNQFKIFEILFREQLKKIIIFLSNCFLPFLQAISPPPPMINSWNFWYFLHDILLKVTIFCSSDWLKFVI